MVKRCSSFIGAIVKSAVNDPWVLAVLGCRATATAICGSDLHIYNGFLPQTRPMVVGHEFMGIVEEADQGVENLKKGDRVAVPFPIACGNCFFCGHGLPGHCEVSNPDKYGAEGGLLKDKGGAFFGYTDHNGVKVVLLP